MKLWVVFPTLDEGGYLPGELDWVGADDKKQPSHAGALPTQLLFFLCVICITAAMC